MSPGWIEPVPHPRDNRPGIGREIGPRSGPGDAFKRALIGDVDVDLCGAYVAVAGERFDEL
jgi:hypothetical protein